MVNKENMRKWVQALRSGKYPQGRSTLRDERGYCCLGVACDVAIEDGLNIEVVVKYDGSYYYDGSYGSLPTSVRNWLGIAADNPRISTNITASSANDTLCWNFAKIADNIEEYYELLED